MNHVYRRNRTKGKLTVIAGPMFSGKTGKLVAMVDVFVRMGHSVLTVKPRLDDRYGGKDEIHSHDHRVSDALVIDHQSPADVIRMIGERDADKIIFDEVQFFDKAQVTEVISQLKKMGKHVIAAGLLYDYMRRPFGATPDLLGLADERLELFAVCQKCGNLARHTERVGGGKDRVVIGAADRYIASCERCHVVYKQRSGRRTHAGK